jgi:hypothetical protein
MLESPGEPLDWIEFTFYNTLSEEGFETDLFIKSIEIFTDETAAVPGDYNEDGTVNAADYTVWRDKLGQSVQLANEVAGVTPGMVTPEDYDAWRIRFANTSGAAAGGAVPEPATIAYLVAAAAGVVALRRLGIWPPI